MYAYGAIVHGGDGGGGSSAFYIGTAGLYLSITIFEIQTVRVFGLDDPVQQNDVMEHQKHLSLLLR